MKSNRVVCQVGTWTNSAWIELLKQLSVGYRRMLKTETPFFVELIREFVEETEPSKVSAE
jgi:hypothetical protein